jgi:hypothetical protein
MKANSSLSSEGPRADAGSTTVSHLSSFNLQPSKDVIFAAYTGPSMNPTLCEPEMIEVLPYGDRPLRVGDVIFFLPPSGGRSFVHRVVQVTARGIRTRGDNNPQRDSYLLQPADVAGRVVAAWRGSKRRRIAGGPAGRLLGWLLRWRRSVDRNVSRVLHPLYHALARRGLVRRLLPGSLRPRLVVFRADGRSQPRLLLGGRIVGRYDARQGEWRIQRPFRLFVDEGVLPSLQEIEQGERSGGSAS